MAQVTLQELVERWCGDRDRFGDSAQAWNRTHQVRREQGVAAAPYRCPVCKRYHVGPPVPPEVLAEAVSQTRELLRALPPDRRREVRGDPPAVKRSRPGAHQNLEVRLDGEAAATVGQRYLTDRLATVTSLAAEFRVSREQVRSWLREELVPVRTARPGKHRRRWTWHPEDLGMIVEMAGRGWTQQEIADRFGVSWPTVARVLAGAGLDWKDIRKRPVKARPAKADKAVDVPQER